MCENQVPVGSLRNTTCLFTCEPKDHALLGDHVAIEFEGDLLGAGWVVLRSRSGVVTQRPEIRCAGSSLQRKII